jgi:hypothetical protein
MRAAAALGALALIGLVAWLVWPMPGAQHSSTAAAIVALPASAAAASTHTAAPAAGATPSAVASVACPHQAVELVFGSDHQTTCVRPARVMQSGSLRRHVYDAERSPGWSLELDVAGSRVVAAALTDRAHASYRCSAGSCAGLAIGAQDRYGVRHFEVTAARLSMLNAAASGSHEPEVVLMSATLRIEQPAARACSSTPLGVVASNGESSAFCADGGAGFELTDDGHYRYRFDDLDGRTLSVTLDNAGHVRDAQLGTLACAGAACGGLASHGDGAIGTDGSPRAFTFPGVRLVRGDGVEATVTGELIVPAQK